MCICLYVCACVWVCVVILHPKFKPQNHWPDVFSLSLSPSHSISWHFSLFFALLCCFPVSFHFYCFTSSHPFIHSANVLPPAVAWHLWSTLVNPTTPFKNVDKCVKCRIINWWNMAEMESNIHDYVFRSVLSPENKNCGAFFLTL